MSSVFFNKGENCIAAGRLFVEESIHDQFISRVVSGPRPPPPDQHLTEVTKGRRVLTGTSKCLFFL